MCVVLVLLLFVQLGDRMARLHIGWLSEVDGVYWVALLV